MRSYAAVDNNALIAGRLGDAEALLPLLSRGVEDVREERERDNVGRGDDARHFRLIRIANVEQGDTARLVGNNLLHVSLQKGAGVNIVAKILA